MSGGGGRDGEVRDGDDGFELLGFEADRAYALGAEGADDEAAQQRRRGVVGVAVELADEVQEIGGGHGAPKEVVGADGSSHQSGGAPAEASGRGDRVLLDEVEVGVVFASELGDEAGGPIG